MFCGVRELAGIKGVQCGVRLSDGLLARVGPLHRPSLPSEPFRRCTLCDAEASSLPYVATARPRGCV